MTTSSAVVASNSLLGPVTLPLFKLSFCTISHPGARMIWKHLHNRNDLFAVFDETRSKDLSGVVVTKQALKLFQGGELLENVDFDTLKYQARLDQERAQSQFIPDDLLFVIMVVKHPLFALRYRLPDGQFRRIQMNFQPPSGCDTALDILRSLGLPLRIKNEAGPPGPSAQRPNSAQSLATTSSSRPQSSISTLSGRHEETPFSAQPPRPQSTSMPQNDNNPDSFSKPITYIGDPRLQPQQPSSFDATYQAYNPITGINLSSTGFVNPNEPWIKPPVPRQLLPSPSFGNEPFYPDNYGNRPITASEQQSTQYLTDTMPISQMLPPIRELPFPNKPTSENSQARFAPCVHPPIEHPTEGKGSQPKKRRVSTVSKTTRSTSSAKSAPKKRSKKTVAAKAKSPTRHPSEPPSSAPPKNQSVVEACCAEAPSSSAPPRVNSTLEALGPTASRVSKNLTPPPSRGSTEANQERPLSAVDDREIDERQAPLPAGPAPASPGHENSLPGSTQTSIQTSEKRLPSAVEDGGVNERQAPTLADPVPAPVPTGQEKSSSPNPMVPNINSAEYLDSIYGWIRKYHDLPAPEPLLTFKDQLAEYASQPDEERAKIIDKMICDCLRDENFGKLSDDVEGHWKRIYLGF
ncbi:hypothetical protein ACLMJK_007813 [Lecanora helva]